MEINTNVIESESSYILQCFTISIVYFGIGFSLHFTTTLLSIYSDYYNAIYISAEVMYVLGIFIFAFLLQYGRRRLLIISDIIAILFSFLILFNNEYVTASFYIFIWFINGCWTISVFIYVKEISITFNSTLGIVFCQSMNYLGQLFASFVFLLEIKIVRAHV